MWDTRTNKMGTRSLTVLYTEKPTTEIVVMYRQMDGYPSGHGQELVDFLNRLTLCNGIPCATDRDIIYANGAECLAAQVVAYFKEGAGEIYLYPAHTRNCGAEYTYHVFPQVEKNTINLRVESYDSVIYFGSTKDWNCDWNWKQSENRRV